MDDESTKFFHKYANCRKHIKSVWKIEKEDGSWVNFFYDIAVEGVNYFKYLFKTKNPSTIDEVIILANSIPIFINSGDN